MTHTQANAELIDVYRLMTLLNEMYRSGQKEFVLFVPYLKEPFFSVRLIPEAHDGKKSVVGILVRFQEYRQRISQGRSGGVAREIPDYNTLQILLVQSGIVEYPNFTDFLALLHEMCQRDFHKGDRPVFMGLDTNLFRDLFYSAHFHTLDRIPHNKIGFSVSPNVKDELSFDKRKYKNRDLKTLSDLCVDSQFRYVVEDFFNQSCLYDRLCRLGWVELEKAKLIHWIELLPELDERELEKSPDLNIIKTYKFAAAERNVDILLLSRDDGFIGHAQGIPGIVTFQIETPVFTGSTYRVAKWRHICQLIYLSAVVCGAVRLQGARDAFLFQGIWKGKKSSDWNRERIKIAALSQSSKVFVQCQKAWRVLDAMG
ncbi:MAG: hypothetical protein ACE5IR_25180 [bacterium]